VLAGGGGDGPVRPAVHAVSGSGGDREWTVDEAHRRVVVGHDVTIDLADKGVLFGLLVALGRRGGLATKEQLQEDVWGERHYHPLRHDNRLKVAVRKLRRLLEDALGDDPLEAVDDGYRLRGRVRFVS
jgi:DNA-binding response OmpR family regulator